MKKSNYLILLFLLIFQLAKATTWVSISAGFWNNTMVWAGGVVPPLSSSDTFKIKHAVAISNNLFFNTGAFLKIDSAGGLCGHNNITIKSGAKFIKYGILEIDSLLIPGGNVSMYATGGVTLTCYGILSNGGSLLISGCSLSVGPWFNCHYPEFQFVGIQEMDFDFGMKLFPNPVSNVLTITLTNTNEENINVWIIDIAGKTIERKELTLEKGKTQLQLNSLSEGIYFIQVRNSSNQIATRKLVVVR